MVWDSATVVPEQASKRSRVQISSGPPSIFINLTEVGFLIIIKSTIAEMIISIHSYLIHVCRETITRKCVIAMSLQTTVRERLARRIAGEIALSDHPGQTMKIWRERFRIPQIILADHLNISPSVISDYESGRRKSPGTNTIRRFVMALLDIDEQNGGQVISAFVRLMDVNLVDLNIVLAMSDFSAPMTIKEFCEKIDCEILTVKDHLDREIYGYTLVDIERAVKELNSDAFLKLFGATTERCLLFTHVSTGRAPLIAIRSQDFKPTFVVLHGTNRVDRLALDLSEQMRIPLGICAMASTDALVRRLRELDQTS